MEKIKSHSVSLSFPKGSNCSLLKFYSSVSSVFVSPRGTTLFQYQLDTFFLSLGRSLNGTFLVTPVYLHRGAPFLSLGRSLNGTFLVTPVYLHRGASSFALGGATREPFSWPVERRVFFQAAPASLLPQIESQAAGVTVTQLPAARFRCFQTSDAIVLKVTASVAEIDRLLLIFRTCCNIKQSRNNNLGHGTGTDVKGLDNADSIYWTY